ncbi:MAG TPA: bifunctional serine/threonine-protein kinase/formylglycine-generating enzyme family protein [Planctomycetota bacterium]|nr:bifunctional serine/threonine-protein kinase/formylglycine-generating enzyme family protein [Planctomycetota bacterium]
MTDTVLRQAVEEWLERALAGEEVEPAAFARAHGLDAEQFCDRIVAARWLLERERSTAGEVLRWREPGPAAGGRRFGRYAVLRDLGRGGQAEVYLAEDTVLHRQVALKVLHGASSERALERLQREALVASKLEHPAICGIHDFGSEAGVPFIAMRYVEGETLASRIANARDRGDVLRLQPAPANASAAAPAAWSWNDIVPVLVLIEQTARALHLAHERGVVHRDVKPANIMITPMGDPVLLDFGLASVPDSEEGVTRTGDVLGTPVYMSPEQLLSGRVERTSDVYSLGTTLYECLTLARPFAAPTRERLFQMIQRQEAPDPRRWNRAINGDLGLVLATAMSKEPRDRYATALDFAEDLARVRTFLPIHARPVTSSVVLSRWARRNPALAASLGTLFLVLAAGLVLTLVLLGNERTALAGWRQLADLERAKDLRTRAESLWPTTPDRIAGVGGFDAWFDETDRLLARMPKHAAALEQLGRSFEPGNSEHAFRRQALTDLLELAKLLEKERESVSMRRAFASDLDRLTIEQQREGWAQAIACAHAPDGPYRGLELLPQRGLIPLGCDPQTHLLEFAHLETGSVPARDAKTGALQITAATGLVLVLLPGGSCLVGLCEPGASRPALDPPEESLDLRPFLLSKYEMTQAQWQTIMGKNPSHYQPGSPRGGKPVDLRHPVESVSAVDCAVLLRRLDMLLPTDAQWEYACRAGTETTWYTGDDPASLQGHANIADEGSRKFYPEGWSFEPGIADGYGATAPVGTYAANPFGLHDMHGNVMEWCRDGWQESPGAARAGDGLREGRSGTARVQVFRGGRYSDRATAVRCAYRGFGDPQHSDHTIGLRPSRALAR